MADISRLTDREKDVLILLATGHDAKSVAAKLGISVHAANERMRSAREKMGVTSSREAARIFAAQHPQENWPKKIELHETPTRPDTGLAFSKMNAPMTRRLLMLTPIFGTIAAIAYWTGLNEARPSGTPQPRIVATSPAQNAVIKPGPYTLVVTFDRPMLAESYSFVQSSEGLYPHCGKAKPQQSSDRRSYSLQCTAKSGEQYVVWLNRARFANFKDATTRIPATPYRLSFSVSR